MDFTKIKGISSIKTAMDDFQKNLSVSELVSEQMSATASVSISAQVSALADADLKQQTAAVVLSVAKAANDMLNSVVSGLTQPIYDAVTEFKDVPPKIRSVVDIQGALNGVYSNMSKLQNSFTSLSNIVISTEVPITLADYQSDPYQYDKLLAIQYQKNEITEEDCLSSGYTKVVTTIDPKWQKKFTEMFQAPEDHDIVAQLMEKLLNSTIKTTWNVVKPPVQTLASLAPVAPISEMVDSVINGIDSTVKVVAKTVPEEKLNQMIAAKNAAKEKAAAEAEKIKTAVNPAGMNPQALAEYAQKESESAIMQVSEGVADGVQDAFKNFQTPSLPDDVKDTLIDFKDSLIMVKDNISNIYIVIILKMIGAIFKCLNKIAGVLGVPSIPAPLNSIPQLLSDINNVINFVMSLPISLYKCVESIVKRKVKMIQVGQTPVPPPPLPTLMPIPPTSKDVVRPETTWEDVEAVLVSDYNFKVSDAKTISKSLQEFYDGSDVKSGSETSQTGVIASDDYKENKFGSEDYMPIIKYVNRYKMEALECKTRYLKSNVNEFSVPMESQKQYTLKVPVKRSIMHVYYKYDDAGSKEWHDYPDWFVLEDFFSEPK